MTREPSIGKEPPNDTFLSHIRRIHTQPIERNQLPETSNQEIGWFNKVMKNNNYDRMGLGQKGVIPYLISSTLHAVNGFNHDMEGF